MELNLCLIERALDYRRDSALYQKVNGGQPKIVVRAMFPDRKGGWVDIPDERATLACLFSTLVAVEDNSFGDFRVKTYSNAPSEYYADLLRFGFSCGFIPVFTAGKQFCEYVVVPSEEDGVLMTAFADNLRPRFGDADAQSGSGF